MSIETGWITGGNPASGLGSAYGTARAAGRAEYGKLGVEAQSVSGFARTYAGFSDTWTILPLDQGLTSQAAWLRFSFDVTGSWQNWGSVKLNNKTLTDLRFEDGTYSGVVTFDQYVVLGEPFTFYWWLIGSTYVPTNPSSVDFLDTANLSGLRVTIGSQELVDYRIAADSGHFYGFGQPVPLPSTTLLLGPALLYLVTRTRRRA